MRGRIDLGVGDGEAFPSITVRADGVDRTVEEGGGAGETVDAADDRLNDIVGIGMYLPMMSR